MPYPTALSSVVLQAHSLWIYFPAPQQWEISAFFMTSQKRPYSLTQSWAICQTVLLPRDPQNKRFLLLCSNKFDSSAYFKSQKTFFTSCKQMRNHWNPAALVKNVSLLTVKQRSFIFAPDEAKRENNQRIYSLYLCSLKWNTSEVSQCKSLIR